jgi:hypothetical protein
VGTTSGKSHFRFLTSTRRAEQRPHTPKRKLVNQLSPSNLRLPMTDTNDEERQKPDDITLTVEEWIELMNKHDRLDQYAKKRKHERREERKREKDESDSE